MDVFGSVTGQLAGTLTIDGFVAQGVELIAKGRMSARVTDLSGNAIGVVTNVAIMMPASIYQAVCTLITLELGPLALDVLGLQSELNRVVLTLTTTAGGGRLAQLLCSSADQFESGAPLSALAPLLNDLVALFAR